MKKFYKKLVRSPDGDTISATFGNTCKLTPCVSTDVATLFNLRYQLEISIRRFVALIRFNAARSTFNEKEADPQGEKYDGKYATKMMPTDFGYVKV